MKVHIAFWQLNAFRNSGSGESLGQKVQSRTGHAFRRSIKSMGRAGFGFAFCLLLDTLSPGFPG